MFTLPPYVLSERLACYDDPQDLSTRLILEYMLQQSKLVYSADAHTLAVKIVQSDGAVIIAAAACGGSLVSPTP